MTGSEVIVHNARIDLQVANQLASLTFDRSAPLIPCMDPKDIERRLFSCAPQAAKDLNAKAKKLIRAQKRADWWHRNADTRSRKPLNEK
jgi:hypothetical protein